MSSSPTGVTERLVSEDSSITKEEQPLSKQERLDAVHRSMTQKEDELSDCKGEILGLQNVVASLEAKLLAGIQEKARLLTQLHNKQQQQQPQQRKQDDPTTTTTTATTTTATVAWQERLQQIKEELNANEEEHKEAKKKLKDFQYKATSLESKIIGDIQQKARIKLEPDNNNTNENEDGDTIAPQSMESPILVPTKKQRVV